MVTYALVCSRVISKMACWSAEPMTGQDLHHFLIWLKDQLKMQVWYGIGLGSHWLGLVVLFKMQSPSNDSFEALKKEMASQSRNTLQFLLCFWKLQLYIKKVYPTCQNITDPDPNPTCQFIMDPDPDPIPLFFVIFLQDSRPKGRNVKNKAHYW